MRLSLREFIRRESDLEVCGEAEDREEALACVAATKPHLAIIDLTLKNSNGMELIKDLRERHPDVKILVLSMHDEILHAERAVRAGARGYITKQEATTKIMVAHPAGIERRDLLRAGAGGGAQGCVRRWPVRPNRQRRYQSTA